MQGHWLTFCSQLAIQLTLKLCCSAVEIDRLTHDKLAEPNSSCSIPNSVLCMSLVVPTADLYVTHRDTSTALYHAIPSAWVFDNLAPHEVPECETALTTLPAQGTAKHRLTSLQLAELERRQEEVAAQGEAAAQLKAKQAARQAEKEAEIRRKKELEKHQGANAKVNSAMDRMRVIEARKQQKIAQEREALKKQKEAARAAQDAAR